MGDWRLYYEDLAVGEPRRFGQYTVTREEVIDFARRFDPHDFHLSDEAAAKTLFGRLSASGWHTCAMSMRMMVDRMHQEGIASLGGTGVDDLRWLFPVYPGDVLSVEMVLIEKRRSQSRPDRGLIRQRNIVYNQDDKPVLSYVINGMVALRDPDAQDRPLA